MRTTALSSIGIFSIAATIACSTIPFGSAAAQDSKGIQNSAENQTMPDKAADTWITTKVKSKLGTTKGISSTNISVSTNDGTVMLSGAVASTEEKSMAINVARSVKGVKNVDASGLMVGTDRTPASSMSGG